MFLKLGFVSSKEEICFFLYPRHSRELWKETTLMKKMQRSGLQTNGPMPSGYTMPMLCFVPSGSHSSQRSRLVHYFICSYVLIFRCWYIFRYLSIPCNKHLSCKLEEMYSMYKIQIQIQEAETESVSEPFLCLLCLIFLLWWEVQNVSIPTILWIRNKSSSL